MEEVLEVSQELFELSEEDKASLYTDDPDRTCKMYTSVDYDKEKVHYWIDSLRHPCHPLEEHMQSWPQKPARYKEVVRRYAVEIRKLTMWVLGAISEGLGLEFDFFNNELKQDQMIAINKYPPCPDPILFQGDERHHGLQVFVDGEWLVVEPLPYAFVVNIGHMLQIISNGKLTCAEHRAVNSKSLARTTIVNAIHPSSNTRIEPAKALVNDSNPPLYKSLIYKEFCSTYMVDLYNRVDASERYTLQQC